MVIGARLSGAVISRKMVVSIGNGFLKTNDPNTLSESGGHITLTDNWSRRILQSMDWIKLKETNGKTETSPQLLAEEEFTLQKSIATVIYDHDIPSDLIINLEHPFLT